jgi:hypothetical protein
VRTCGAVHVCNTPTNAAAAAPSDVNCAKQFVAAVPTARAAVNDAQDLASRVVTM